MRVLYNTTKVAAMNDVSVTTGNADGWILLPLDPVHYEIEPPPPAYRRPAPLEAQKRPRSIKPKR